MSLLEITKWNYKRNGLVLDRELERNMLDEEAQEFNEGLIMYLNNTSLKLEAVVDMVDAYCDFNFVYTGTISKQIGDSQWIDEEKRMMYMNTYLIEILFAHGVQIFTPEGKSIIDSSIEYVIEANKKKPITKTSGKVIKGEDWVDPKEQIKELLISRGWNDSVDDVAKQRELQKVQSSTTGGTMEDFVANFNEDSEDA
jgi:hypothetical protein